MKFIHLADCHLASENKFSSSIGDFIRKKSWETFENILADNKNADFAMIAGDLFERSYFTIKDYKRLFDLIKSYKKNVYYVTGNHDYIGDDNKIFFMDKPENLKMFSTSTLEYFEENTCRIYGISYKDRIFDELFEYDITLDSKFFNILLIHGVLGEEESPYLNLDENRLKSMGFDYVALGHIHKPISISENICYAGTTEAKDFSENLDYGYIYYDENGPRRIDLSKLKFTDVSFKASDFLNEDELIKSLSEKKSDKINFLRINLKNDSNFLLNEEKIKSKLNLFYLEIKEEKSYDLADLKSIYKDTLLSGFLENAESIDENQKIVKKAIDLGLDAIMRSRYD